VGTDLVVPLPFGTDLSTLLTSFIHTGSELKLGRRALNNCESSINATNPVMLTVVARDGSTRDYRLRVSLVNEFVSIGGTVSGLGTGLNLSITNNGTDSLNITSNGSFTFNTPVQNGSEYNVSIITQPMGQICSISGGSGVANTNVNSISVVCAYLPGAAPQSFTDNGDGTITDNNTKLIWQKCSRGQNSLTCSGSATTINWNGAINYCTGLTNLPTPNPRTCRLPSKDELVSIVDYNKTAAAAEAKINLTYFPNTVAYVYWSSTTYAPETPWAWVVDFDPGFVYNASKTLNLYVRCVSGP
jgi:hypothetical protein